MAAKRVLNGLKTGLAVVGTLGIGTGIAGSYAFRAVREAKQVLHLCIIKHLAEKYLVDTARMIHAHVTHVQALQKLPPEFVLELDLEDIQLVERSASGSTVQVG